MSRDFLEEYEKFLQGEVNSCHIILSREKGNNVTLYHVSDYRGEELFNFFRRNGEPIGSKRERKNEQTGGKKPYAMLLQDGLERLRGNTPPSNIGFLALLSSCIEMGTGRLRHRRSKKSMTLEDISEHLYISRSTAKRFVKDMSDLGVISYERGKGYYISRSYLLRGVKRDEEGKTVREATDSEGT